MSQGEIVIYVTSITAIRKTQSECDRLCSWFDALKIDYTRVDLGVVPEKRAEMEQGSGGKKTLPQVHINGTYVGGFEEIEMQVENDYLLEFLQEKGYTGTGISKVKQ